MATVTKDLGIATAYGYAKSKGYTGTEDEFAQAMLDMTTAVDDAQQYAQDAEDAKDDAEASAQSIEQSAQQIATNTSDIADLKADLSQISENTITKTYTEVVATSNHIGNRVYYNSTYNRIAETDAGTTRAYSVYAVTQGKYRIYGFGYDNPLAVLAVVGNDNLVTSGESACDLLQVVDSGVTDKYAWSTVEVEIETSGYLYINYQTAQSPKLERITESSTYTVKTDKTLTDADLPANAKSVGDVIGSGVHGLYKDGNDYYHFVRTNDTYLIRKFNRRGINNLFQWVGTYLGSVSEDGVTIDSTLDSYQTDIIGPLSIWNNTLWPNVYGMWAGGNHGKTVDGVSVPTAEQDTFSCLVNGSAVSDDGLYYGNVIFKTKNKIYFPQSITGDDLTTATQSLNEYRVYSLDSDMNVKVRLEFVENTRISLYYGMQAVTMAYDVIEAYNNNFCKAKSTIDTAQYLSAKEHKIVLIDNDTGLTLDMELKDIGIGTYGFNTGAVSSAPGFVYVPIQTGASRVEKIYYILAAGTTAEQVTSGMNLFWEGEYSIYYA